MMFGYDHDMGGWGYAGMAIGMVLFWTLIVVGIVVLIRFSAGTTRTGTVPAPSVPVEPPERVLATRFARGEIDETEYRSRLEVLRATAHG